MDIRSAAILCGMLSSLHAQAVPPPSAAEWPMFNRDLAGTRYSPLTQINTRNVAQLTRAWSYHLGFDSSAAGITGGSEFTPLVVQGVLYLGTAKAVVALEPETGNEIWRYPVTTMSRRGVVVTG